MESSSSEDSMNKYPLSYYYVSPKNAERIESFRELSGDSEKSLISQYVRGWIGRNRDYYLQLARIDAAAREISFRQWGETVFKDGIEALPDYKQEVTNLPPNPLWDVTLSSDATVRRQLNYITLGTQNLVLLKVGIYYDRDGAIGFISRIVKEHLDRNWDKLYAPQVEAENFENWV
ncbi:transposase [Scytonema hofmannii PCC 7110]|uniref:Transposase n=1 Tax=Scytonema hofmannii PCC 7110 TaxID=128403 RepID=A0A139WQ69_9CYAN|nr:hypothetical protein [Scytonema hofmannii]KYC34579.1 transposase [Scytonema hofmannii PCC 7110]